MPATVAAFVPAWSKGWFINLFNTNTWTYAVIYFLLIIFFAYFYSTIQFNPIEVANNLKKNGGFIPGFRAGKPTSEFIQKVLTKITLFGAPVPLGYCDHPAHHRPVLEGSGPGGRFARRHVGHHRGWRRA